MSTLRVLVALIQVLSVQVLLHTTHITKHIVLLLYLYWQKSMKSVQKVQLEQQETSYVHTALSDDIQFGLRPNRHHQLKFGLSVGLRHNFDVRIWSYPSLGKI